MDVFSTLMKKKLADKYVDPNNIVGTHKAPIGRLKGKATLKPRVTCSACEFVGIEGKEMEMHVKKKHPTFDCNQCTYKCTLKIVLKRHKNSQHNHKCSSVYNKL